jgi:hypothetical protein
MRNGFTWLLVKRGGAGQRILAMTSTYLLWVLAAHVYGGSV